MDKKTIEFDKGEKVILRNQDCMEFMKEIPDNFVDLIVTDPPYEVCTNGAGIYKQSDKQYVKRLNSMKDGYDNSVLDEMCRVMKRINICLWCSQKQIIHLLNYFVSEKKCNYDYTSYVYDGKTPFDKLTSYWAIVFLDKETCERYCAWKTEQEAKKDVN